MSSNSKKKSLNFESTLDEIEKIIESLDRDNINQMEEMGDTLDDTFKELKKISGQDNFIMAVTTKE